MGLGEMCQNLSTLGPGKGDFNTVYSCSAVGIGNTMLHDVARSSQRHRSCIIVKEKAKCASVRTVLL